VVIVRLELIVIDRVAVAASLGLPESCTCTVKVEVPEAEGVPEIMPVLLLNESPAGRVPLLMVKL
jgi:hypothetical protein